MMPMVLVSISAPPHREDPKNSRFEKGDVIYLTLHQTIEKRCDLSVAKHYPLPHTLVRLLNCLAPHTASEIIN